MTTSVLVGAAVLRVTGGVFYGIGDPPSEDPPMAEEASEETSETDEAKGRTPLSMVVPPVALVAAAFTVGLLPYLGALVQDGAVRFQDQAAYNATVLGGAHIVHPVPLLAPEDTSVTSTDVITGVGTAAASLVLALMALYWRRLPILRPGFEPGTGLVGPIRRFQSGVVNDYVTWMVVGLACIGGALAFAIRSTQVDEPRLLNPDDEPQIDERRAAASALRRVPEYSA